MVEGKTTQMQNTRGKRQAGDKKTLLELKEWKDKNYRSLKPYQPEKKEQWFNWRYGNIKQWQGANEEHVSDDSLKKNLCATQTGRPAMNKNRR